MTYHTRSPTPRLGRAVRRALLPVAGLLAAAAAACGDDATPEAAVAVRDSAGVTIVENPGDVWAAPPAWTLAAEPRLQLGVADGEEPYLFDGIRSLVPLSDGRFVVANSGDATLRWYDATGTFLFQRGGHGGGPGEFNRLGNASPLGGDSIVAVDWSARRMTTFGPDGGLDRVASLAGLPGPPGTVYRLPDGSLITGVSGFSSTQLGERPEDGIVRIEEPLLRLSADGSRADTLGMFPGMEVDVQVSSERLLFGPARFGRSMNYSVHGNDVWVGTEEAFVIDAYGPDGVHRRSVRAPAIDVRVDDAFREAYFDFQRGRMAELPEDRRQELERALAETEFPAARPAYSSVLTDARGNLWVGEYRIDLQPPERWLIFEPEGRLLGTLTLPPGVRILAVADDTLWGRATGDLGVEQVVAYTLER
ncbi:MAG: hypothetical protein WEB88_06415 [Gemmatimonadota bacterium]